MARLHLALSADEEAEFVASHLETIVAQLATDFDNQLREFRRINVLRPS